MFWAALGQLLPLTVGVTISPLPVAAVIALLVAPGGRWNGLAFTAAFVTITAAVTVVLVVLADTAGADDSTDARRGVAVLPLVVGILFAVLAVRSWQNRPRAGAAAVPPKWMTALEGLTAGKAAGVGALIAGAGLKNITLAAAAGVVISSAAVPGWEAAVLVTVFIVLGCAGVAAPVLFVAARGAEQAVATLQSWRRFLVAHNAVIMTVLFTVLAATNLGHGLEGLAGGGGH